jgi:hypothetical protein
MSGDRLEDAAYKSARFKLLLVGHRNVVSSVNLSGQTYVRPFLAHTLVFPHRNEPYPLVNVRSTSGP